MRRILLTGAGGQVGWEIARRLEPVSDLVALDRSSLDLSDALAIRSVVRETRPSIVINAAAYTAVDAAESDGETCRAINSAAPAILSEEARKLGALMIHFSTDYVYDGAKDSAYVETDAPNPIGEYGRSKLEGDRAVEGSGAHHMIFRLCWVYSLRGKNFFLTIRRLAAERDALRVVADQTGCPTWAGTIADAVCQALEKRRADKNPSRFDGLYHLAARGETTWHGFAKAIVDGMEKPRCEHIEAITTAEFPTPARRPAFSVLSCDRIEKTFGFELPEWRAALGKMLRAEKTPLSTHPILAS